MTLNAIELNIELFPEELHPFLNGAKLYDSSCSPEARVIFIDKDCGYFLKSAQKGVLEREAAMTRYFHGKGMAAEVIAYISDERNLTSAWVGLAGRPAAHAAPASQESALLPANIELAGWPAAPASQGYDWLLTTKIRGDDCTAAKYIEEPEQLCDILAERLTLLHASDITGCPVPNHTERYLARIEYNKYSDLFNKSHFPDSFGYVSAEEAWEIVVTLGHTLKTDTLLHGDYCLPNIIMDDWRFGGFIDLDNGGVGDRHVDLFWGAWSLYFNLETDKYRDRFFDAYGRDKIDEDMLRVVAACEVFG